MCALPNNNADILVYPDEYVDNTTVNRAIQRLYQNELYLYNIVLGGGTTSGSIGNSITTLTDEVAVLTTNLNTNITNTTTNTNNIATLASEFSTLQNNYNTVLSGFNNLTQLVNSSLTGTQYIDNDTLLYTPLSGYAPDNVTLSGHLNGINTYIKSLSSQITTQSILYAIALG